jgi:hypothetical protein
MGLLATLVDTTALGKAVLWGFVSGIGVTTIFAIAVAGSARVSDLRRDDRLVAAALWAAVALVAFGGFVIAIVFGIEIMTSKT